MSTGSATPMRTSAHRTRHPPFLAIPRRPPTAHRAQHALFRLLPTLPFQIRHVHTVICSVLAVVTLVCAAAAIPMSPMPMAPLKRATSAATAHANARWTPTTTINVETSISARNHAQVLTLRAINATAVTESAIPTVAFAVLELASIRMLQ